MPLGIKAGSEFWVAMQRINNYFTQPEIPDHQLELIKEPIAVIKRKK